MKDTLSSLVVGCQLGSFSITGATFKSNRMLDTDSRNLRGDHTVGKDLPSPKWGT